MIKTDITTTGMGYLVRLTDDQQDAEFCRWEVEQVERGHKGLSAVVVVRSHLATKRAIGDYVMSGWLEFEDMGSKDRFSKRLDELLPPPEGGAHLDWVQVVEHVTFSISGLESVPTDLLDLSRVEPVSDVPHLVPFLIPEKRPTILYGPGGVGKSMFAAALAVAVASGTPFLNMATRKAPVLYLDWETEPGDIAGRIQRAAKGAGLEDAPTILYMNLIQSISDRMGEISRVVAEHSIGLVIIDSVGMASARQRDGADPSEGAKAFFRGLRGLDTAALLIDHVTGEDMKVRTGVPKPYGSVYKWNAARNAFELRAAEKPTGHQVVLAHRKSNLGPRENDVPLTFVYGADSVQVVRTDLYENLDAERDAREHERVLAAVDAAALTGEPLHSQAAVARASDMAEAVSRAAVVRLEKSGQVRWDPMDGLIREERSGD